MKSVLQRLMRYAKRQPDYSVDPELSANLIVGLLARRGLMMLRGLFIRPFLGCVEGILLVGRGVSLVARSKIKVGHSCVIEDYVTIDALSRNGVTLGDNVSIGHHVLIRCTGVISQLGEGLTVGDKCAIGAFSYIGAAGGITIGNDVLIGQRVSFHAENHIYTDLAMPIRVQGVTRRGIFINDDCWIGSGSIILDGVTIGRGAVVAAGSIVNREVPSNAIVAGVPAKVVGRRGAPTGSIE